MAGPSMQQNILGGDPTHAVPLNTFNIHVTCMARPVLQFAQPGSSVSYQTLQQVAGFPGPAGKLPSVFDKESIMTNATTSHVRET